MSLATNRRTQPSKACEMGFSAEGGVALIGRLWYKSAAHSIRSISPSTKLSDTGTPRMSPPTGAWSAATDQKPTREVNCVI
jgi:hypothetical protein